MAESPVERARPASGSALASGGDPEVNALRLPPHSVEAEQSVLGALLIDNPAWDVVADVLRSEDFYRYDHRLIFQAVARLIEARRPADVVTVHDVLKTAGQADEVGGLSYLNSLATDTPSSANVRRYAEIVRDRSVLRRLISTADTIATSALNPQGRETRQLLDEAESTIFRITEDSSRGQEGFQDITTLVGGVLTRVSELYDQGGTGDVTGVPSGYSDLDRMTSGFQAGDLVIVAGRPSMGKTAFSLNLGEHIALEAGLPVAVFSMEMGASQLATRMLCSIGRIDSNRLRTGRLTDDDWARLTGAIGRMQDMPMFIDETPALSVLDLRARARRLARQQGKFGMVIIDYLQLMSGSGGGENRATEISEITRSLKSLAKELRCPVVALSQLNRSLETRPNKRPVMSDLRESGGIEQDADLILFVYRDEVYNPDTPDKNTAEIIIGKQRNGPIGTVRLTFAGQFTRFENYAPGSGF
jgi:replicative DNA helicase